MANLDALFLQMERHDWLLNLKSSKQIEVGTVNTYVKETDPQMPSDRPN